jgi:hypothetical protein
MTKTFASVAFAAMIASGALVYTATGASADVVCNGDGDCWHTHERYTYPGGVTVTVHPDDWKWQENEKYRWHEHDGRGYWKGGVWIGF